MIRASDRLSLLRRFLSDLIVEALYPPRCAGCGRRGHWVCNNCIDDIDRIAQPYCHRCGVPAESACVCAELAPELDFLRSSAWYGGWLKSAIHLFKYEGEFARDAHLASLLAPLVEDAAPDLELVPVPLHRDRERRRGYNQAERLATALSTGTGMKVACVLDRTTKTRQQVGLLAVERATNVRGAFTVRDGSVVAGKRFVLIDDVTTTGATLGACAESLKTAGAVRVGAITIARER